MMKFFPCLLMLLVALLWSCQAEQSAETTTAEPASSASADTSATAQADSNAISAAVDSSRWEYDGNAVLLDWKMLSDVTFEEEYSEEVQAYIPYPTFGEQLKALEGRVVQIEGYIIPLEETGDETILVLSAQPYSSCFFCGGAGPESVMDIKLKPDEKRRFTTDERMTFRGRLRLNDHDLYYLNYILEEAEVAG